MIRKICIYSLLFASVWGCKDSEGRLPASLLPLSVAAPGEIFISMDSLQWRGEVGHQLRELLMSEVRGLPREEYTFTLRYIQPQNMSSTLRQVSNIIYVTTFDINRPEARIIQNYFPEESKQKILNNSEYFLTTAKDVYARDQEIMYLFGQSESSLLANLKESGQRIIDHFNRIERERTARILFSKQEKGVEDALKRNFGLSLKIPNGYQLAQLNENFAWIVWQQQEVDKHVWISYMDYYSQAQFETDSVVKFRDYIARKFIYEDKDTDASSYMITEVDVPFIPVQSRQINLNGKYAVDTRGLWRTNNHSMGGPFLGVSVVDETTDRLYYIEGFIYSPGEPQREFMREIEAIIYSVSFAPEQGG